MHPELPRFSLFVGIVLTAGLILWVTPATLAQTPPATPEPDVTPAPAATPPPSPAPVVEVIRPIPFVPSADYLGAVGGNAAALALRGVARAPMGGFQQLTARVFTSGGDADLNVVFFTPPGLSYRSPAVAAVHGTLLRLVLGGVSGLLLLVGAANLALRRRWGLPVDEPGALLLRILAASVAALVSLEALGLAVELNNALVRLLLAVPLCEVGADCRPHVFGTLGASFARLTALTLLELDLVELLATFALGVVLIILVIQHAVRIGLLAVLLAVSPLAFALWVLPQTRWLARLWTGSFFPTLLAQPLQVLAYLLAAGLLASVRPPGQATPGANVVSVLIGLAALGVSLGLPRLLRAGASSLESPLRTATKTLMLWTLAERLAGRTARGDHRPAHPTPRQAAGTVGTAGRVEAAPASAGRRTVPLFGLGLGLAPPASSLASLSRPADGDDSPSGRGAVRFAGDGPSRSAAGPFGDTTARQPAGDLPSPRPADEARQSHAVAALLNDPAATIYFTDAAVGGQPQPFEPARGLPATADRGSFVAAFADRRPDRPLSAAEVDALMTLATAAPPVGSHVEPVGVTPAASAPVDIAATPSPIVLPPPLPRPVRTASPPAPPPSTGEGSPE